MADYKIVDITPSNVDKFDMFCKKSKSKEMGYQSKLAWFKKNKPTMKLLHVNEGEYTSRGFIEYTPIEKAWRAVKGKNYLFIQCLWVVGRWKKKGLGTKLLQEAVKDAKKQGKAGVVAISSSKNWLYKSKIFLKNGFKIVQSEGPFDLLVKKFKQAPDPSFPEFKDRAKKYGKGLTVIYTNQCPYIYDAIDIVRKFASKKKIPFKTVELKSASDVQQKSPTPYGTYALVKDGKLLTYTYLLEKDLIKLVK